MRRPSLWHDRNPLFFSLFACLVTFAAPAANNRTNSLQYCSTTKNEGQARAAVSSSNTCMGIGQRLAGFKGAVAWERYLDTSRPDFLFVQVGANEGMAGDALWPYASVCNHWRGLLVEPVASSFTKLCLNYQPMSTRIRALKAAVSDFNGFADMQIMRNGCAGGQCNHLLHRGDNRRWHHRWARTNETERVPVITLARVWEELQRVHGPVADVDLLVVDVEGSEGRLLGSSELPSPRPRLVMFEHKHLTAPVRFMINSSLESLGYQFVGGVAGGVGGVVTARHGDWLWQRRGSEIPN